jgi:hypothetical protein
VNLLLELIQRTYPEGMLKEHPQGFVGLDYVDTPDKIRANHAKPLAYGFQEHFSRILKLASLLTKRNTLLFLALCLVQICTSSI